MRPFKLRGVSTRVKSTLVVMAILGFFVGSLTADKKEKPTISDISPSSVTAGGPGFTLTVNGSNYASDSVVNWDGASRPTTVVSSTQLRAAISANDVARAGTVRVTVTNPDNQGNGKDTLTSNDVTFSINNPEPTLGSLTPSSATAGGSSLTLSAQGSNFVNESTIRWNGSNRSTTFVSTSQLTASIPASDIATAGTASVTVVNPGPGGGTSNALTFTINPASPPLKITTSSPLPDATAGTAYSVTLAASGGTPPYTWSVTTGTLPAGFSLNPSSGVVSGTPSAAGNFNITVQVTDGVDAKSAKDFTIGVSNPAPAITSLSPSSATGGDPSFTLSVGGSNFVKGSTVRWNGSNRSTTFVSTSQLTASIPASDISTAGNASVTVANPGPGGGTSNALTFTINPASPPLKITTSSPLPDATAGTAYSVTLAASGGTPPYTWSVSAGTLPAGLSLSPSSGVVSGTPTSAGNFSFSVQATDGSGTKSAKDFAASINNPVPTITSLNPSSADMGGPAFTLSVRGSNFVTGSVVRWKGSNRPTNFVSTTELTVAVAASDIASAGTADVVVFNAAPGGGTSNSTPFTISTAPLPLSITATSPLVNASVGISYSQSLGATGGTQPYAWSVTAGSLPPGLVLTSSSGVLSGTPAIAGSFHFTVQVSDSTQPTSKKGTKDFDISVTNPVPVISSLNPSKATAGSPGFTLSLVGSNFIEGVSKVQWNGTDRATTFVGSSQLNAGIPASDITTAGSATVTVFNPGPGGGTSNSVTFIISPAVLNLTILTSSPLPTGVVSKTYSQTLVASGGTPPYSWSITSGTLPTGLTVDLSTGAINGVPSAVAVYNFTAQVTDNAKATSSKAFSIEIIGSGSNPPPTITTAPPLPEGTVGFPYEQSLVATGGSPPYSWSVTAGALPAGLVLDSPAALISGTPSISGTFSFTLQVADSRQTNTSKAFTVSINPQLPELHITGLTDSVEPAQQPKIGLESSAPYPVLLSGKMTLSFTPDAVNPSDDTAVQFSAGGRVVSFTIPANGTKALFEGSAAEAAFQTGTVAGTIKLEVKLEVGGEETTPPPDPSRTATVNRGPPKITSVSVGSKTESGFEVVVVGFSTPRSLDQVTFHFSPREGRSLQTTTVSLDMDGPANAWYQSETSNRFGSQFRFAVPFTIQGDMNSIGSVSVTLTNTEGASEPVGTGL